MTCEALIIYPILRYPSHLRELFISLCETQRNLCETLRETLDLFR
jgi:hypothetical protein